jgi:hypothetical protein
MRGGAVTVLLFHENLRINILVGLQGKNVSKIRPKLLSRPLAPSLCTVISNCATFFAQNIFFPLAAICVQSRQFFASMLREELFELKNEDFIKKSENLRDTCAC